MISAGSHCFLLIHTLAFQLRGTFTLLLLSYSELNPFKAAPQLLSSSFSTPMVALSICACALECFSSSSASSVRLF